MWITGSRHLLRLVMSHAEPTQAAAPDVAPRAEPPRVYPRPASATSPWQFPGCEAIHLSRDELADYEGKVEFWDADIETAWVASPPSPYHESPSQILAALVDRNRRGAGLAHPLLREHGRDAARRARRAAPRHAAGPGGVPAPGAGEPAGARGAGDRRARVSGRGPGGGLLDRCAAEQAGAVCVVGASPKCGWRCRRSVRRAARGGGCRS